MPRMIKSALILFGCLTLGSKCEKHPPPETLLCAIGANKLNCHDPRLNPQSFDLPLKENMICTDPDSYDELEAYCSKLRTNLINCERKGPY